ncbi:hypothetical protein [Streptomyces sp. CB01881]|uniref:LppU/SCO3897 family protein n=1 Tax=Streptomyces sp. CB01881 TaxID=2078691 RepID=UPI000CDCC6C1|nr:hypothetical protein [Streptomyces sp. CB01881]AUY50763.1 hypothetical protein C2142_19480 [Streptomyces sp. CB01881]TYC74148.1 hypothetical protein EH183_19455 [Streptomyces sp. CB01881]
MPYGAPPPADNSNPYAAGNPYGAQQPGYGYPAAPPPAAPGYGVPPQAAPPGYGYPAAPQQAGYAPQAPHGGPVCRFCGGFPAVDTTVRGHQGIIIIMRFLRQPGPFCRTCGTAMVRDMSARTMVQGWWSYLGSIFTLVTLLRNLAAHNKIKDLPPPAPGTHGPQLDPGAPLMRRPHALMLLLPVLWIISLIVLLATGALLNNNHDNNSRPYHPIVIPTPSAVTMPPMPSFSLPPIPEITTPGAAKPSTPAAPSKVADDIDSAKVGDCLRNENGTSATHDPNPRITMLPCSDSRAQYKVLRKLLATSDDKACDNVPESDSSYTRTSSSAALSYVLCLKGINGT